MREVVLEVRKYAIAKYGISVTVTSFVNVP